MVVYIMAIGLVIGFFDCIFIIFIAMLDYIADGEIFNFIGKKIKKLLAKWSDEE